MESPDRPPCKGRLASLLAQPFSDLQPLLAEEAEQLWGSLRWQVEPWEGPLEGLAWVRDGRVLGYLPLQVRARTLILGRLFASRSGPSEAVELELLGSAIQGAFSDPGILGVCGELLLATPATLHWLLSRWPGRARPRLLMEAVLTGTGTTWTGTTLEPWRGEHLIPASGLLQKAYAGAPQGGLDPAFDDPERISRSLARILDFPTRGKFEPAASFVARAPGSGELLGFVLASRMGLDQGHVSELAVDPGARRRGIGRTLMTGAMAALRDLGCGKTHLAVDQDNTMAIGLYRSLGFLPFHRFATLGLEREA